RNKRSRYSHRDVGLLCDSRAPRRAAAEGAATRPRRVEGDRRRTRRPPRRARVRRHVRAGHDPPRPTAARPALRPCRLPPSRPAPPSGARSPRRRARRARRRPRPRAPSRRAPGRRLPYGGGSAPGSTQTCDQDLLEVLARPSAGPPVDVAGVPPLEAEAGALEDLGIEIAAVVDDDADGSPRFERGGG